MHKLMKYTTMKDRSFITENFLLRSKYAEELYHEYASKQPIIDYHNHLSPKLIAENKPFANLTEAWIEGDHYKWRAMRALKVEEKYLTGDASPKEKFMAYAKTVPFTVRNPLYHWTHLELKRYFDLDELLSEKNAADIYEEASAKLKLPEYKPVGLLDKFKVEFVCTTEDPTDDLKHHREILKQDLNFQVSTAFRPDKALNIQANGFSDFIKLLSEVSEIEINSIQELKDALVSRIRYFHENGCRICDHGLSHMPLEESSDAELKIIFQKGLEKKSLSNLEAEKYRTAILRFLCEQYAANGWVQQFHLGPLRNNNSRMLQKLGPDTGWDSIGDYQQAEKLSGFLDLLDRKNVLAKTILYNNNPADNAVFATMAGNFNDGSIKGKVQFGSGWWHLDQKNGMTDQLNTLSNMGLISTFIGMLTDSRSMLSFPRHEYFRRVLCNLFGEDMANGELPTDIEFIGGIINDICYFNAKEYLEL